MTMAMVTVARVMAMATRVRASNNEGNDGGDNCGGNEGGKQ
jgi:hypothetical protein